MAFYNNYYYSVITKKSGPVAAPAAPPIVLIDIETPVGKPKSAPIPAGTVNDMNPASFVGG